MTFKHVLAYGSCICVIAGFGEIDENEMACTCGC